MTKIRRYALHNLGHPTVEEDPETAIMIWPEHFWDIEAYDNPSYNQSAYSKYLIKTFKENGGKYY